MKKTKYITSGGLAFSEEKDMEKLRQYSFEGWHVSDFQFMGYKLTKGEQADYIYSIDYQSVTKDEEEEYLTFFSTAGWSRVASESDIHLFRASAGTKPIYTDRDTRKEKYKQSSTSMKKLMIPLSLVTICAWIGTMISTGFIAAILLISATILSVIALPLAWTTITTYQNKWLVEEKTILVNLMKVLPFLILFTALIPLFIFDMHDIPFTVKLFIFMVVGALLFPIIMRGFTFIYHKMIKKKIA